MSAQGGILLAWCGRHERHLSAELSIVSLSKSAKEKGKPFNPGEIYLH